MKKILIITDSACDLNVYRLSPNVFVLPCYYDYKDFTRMERMGTGCGYGNKYIANGVDPSEVKNFGVNYYDTLNTMNYAIDNDMDIIIIPTNKKYSKKNNTNIQIAANEFMIHNPKINVAIYQYGGISMSLGLLIKKIDQLINSGWEFKEIVKFLYRFGHKYTYEFITDDFSYMIDVPYVSRIDKCALKYGDKKYLFKVKAGRVAIAGSANDNYSLKELLIERFIDRVDFDEEVSVVHSDDPFNAFDLRDAIKERYCINDIQIKEQSISSSSIIRPKSLGIAYRRK